jgi:hypothetical protein
MEPMQAPVVTRSIAKPNMEFREIVREMERVIGIVQHVPPACDQAMLRAMAIDVKNAASVFMKHKDMFPDPYAYTSPYARAKDPANPAPRFHDMMADFFAVMGAIAGLTPAMFPSLVDLLARLPAFHQLQPHFCW